MLNEKGFTLIEVMSAMAILGISLGLIISLFASGVRTVKITEEYSRALRLGREKLTERISFRGETPLGGSSGRVDGYEWALVEEPFMGSEGIAGGGNSGLYMVEVRVRWEDGGRSKDTAFYGLVSTGRYAKEGSI